MEKPGISNIVAYEEREKFGERWRKVQREVGEGREVWRQRYGYR